MFGLFYTSSIQLVGMGTAAVLIYLMPSLVMLFSVVFLHEKFTPGKGLCLVLSLLGCALVSGVAGGVWRKPNSLISFMPAPPLPFLPYSPDCASRNFP